MACEGFAWINQEAAVEGWLASFDGTGGTLILEFGLDTLGGGLVAEGFTISPLILYDDLADVITFFDVPPGEYTFTAYNGNGCSTTHTIVLGFGFSGPFGVWAVPGIRYIEAPDDPADVVVSRTLLPGFPPSHPIAVADPILAQGTYPEVAIRATNRNDAATFDIAAYCRARLVSTREPQPVDPSGRLWAAQLGVSNATAYLLDSGLNSSQLNGYLSAYLLSPFRTLLPYWGATWQYRTYYLQYLPTPAQLTIKMIDVEDTIEVSLELGGPPTSLATVSMPCPTYPLPICWLSPEGGEGFWIFSAKHTYGLTVGEGVSFYDAADTERLLSRGDVRDVVSVESGYLPNPALYDGLRTLFYTPQAWAYVGDYTLDTGEWLPIIIEGGERTDYRSGEKQRQATVRFRFADPIPVQGS